MPIARFEFPDGRIGRFEVPEGTTPEQAQGMIASQFLDTKAPQPQESISRTALDQGLQGATFGFADEATDRIGAGIASAFTDEKYDDLLKEARGMSKDRMQRQMEQNPGTAIGANIAGALLTGGAGASTKAGTAIGNSLRTGGTLARIGKGAAAGAASGGLYGAGAADEGKRLDGAGEGALYGAAIGGAIPAAGALASKTLEGGKVAVQGIAARTPEVLQDTAKSMRSSAGGLYNQMRQVGAVLNPSSSNGLLSTVDAAIKKQKFIPALNPKTTAIIDDLTETIRANNGQIGLDELDQYRRMLTRIGGSEDGVSAGAAKRAIDDIVDNLNNNGLVNGNTQAVQLLNQGRAEYARASRFDEISDILVKADGDPNKIKSGLTRFVSNVDNLKGYTSEEVGALKEAARSTTAEKLLKMGGKFGIDLGSSFTAGNTFIPAVATMAGQPALAVAGTGARQAQKYLSRGKAEKALQVIEGALPAAPRGNLPVAPLGSLPGGASGGMISASDNSMVPAALQPVQQPQMMPQAMEGDQTFDRLLMAESGNRDFDTQGNIIQGPMTKYGRAEGAAQVLPMTQRDPGFGVAPAKNKSPEELRRVGEEYFDAMKDKYSQNLALALMAYNWGPGNTDEWLANGANPAAVPQETQKYLAKILRGQNAI